MFGVLPNVACSIKETKNKPQNVTPTEHTDEKYSGFKLHQFTNAETQTVEVKQETNYCMKKTTWQCFCKLTIFCKGSS